MLIDKVLLKRYKIIEEIGSGGFGDTYVAVDLAFPGKPRLIVKHLYPRNNNPRSLAIAKRLFEAEATVLSRLGKQHDQIPSLLAYFEEGGQFYLVQELIEGHNLTKEFQSGKRWSEAETLKFLQELLEILSVVHRESTIHRDLKPANIMRCQKDGKLVLIDFGAVKEVLTVDKRGQTDTVAIGTPPYIAPEQAMGKPKKSSDIYAVGIIGIQALTGLSSRQLLEYAEPLERILNGLNIEIDSRLKNVLTKMINFQYKQRYSDADEALKALAETEILPNPRVPDPKPKRFILPIALGISAIGMFLFPLAQKFLPITNISYAPQLPLNGQIVKGNLDSNSQIEPLKNTYSDVYLVNGRKEQQITIEMNSNELDPSLILYKPDGRILANNDDISPTDFNSRIVATLPEDGSYQVIVRASQPGETGSYQLKVSTK